MVRAPYAVLAQANLRDSRARLQRPALGRHTAQPHDIADDFGYRAIVFLRNFLVDLHSCMQGAGERRILDHGNAVFFGDLADLAAIRSTPLETQTGAFMPRSYLRAMA
jgi:hypothetical protein